MKYNIDLQRNMNLMVGFAVLATSGALLSVEKKAQKDTEYQCTTYAMPCDMQKKRGLLSELINDMKIFPTDICALMIEYLDRRGKFFRSCMIEPRGPKLYFAKRVTAIAVIGNKYIVVGSHEPQLYVWNVELLRSATPVLVVPVPTDGVTALTVVANRFLAGGTETGNIMIWDVSDPCKVIHKYTLDGAPSRVTAVSSCSTLLAAGFDNGSIITWKVMADEYQCRLRFESPDGNSVSSLLYTPTKHLMVGTRRGGLIKMLNDVQCNMEKNGGNNDRPICNIVLLRSGACAYLTSQSIKICEQRGSILSTPSFNLGHQESPTCCAVDYEGRLLVGWEKSGITVHDEEGSCREETRSVAREGVAALVVLPDGSCITGGFYGALSHYQPGIDIADTVPCDRGRVILYNKTRY